MHDLVLKISLVFAVGYELFDYFKKVWWKKMAGGRTA